MTKESTFGEGDIRAVLPRFGADALEANLALVDRVKVIADRLDATTGQVALAWLLAQQDWIVPIPGTRKVSRLTENLGALDLTLTEADLAELTAASDAVAVVGERYPKPWPPGSTHVNLRKVTSGARYFPQVHRVSGVTFPKFTGR